MAIGGGVLGILVLAMLSLPARAQMPGPSTAPVDENAPAYVITFFETGAASTKKAADILRHLAAASRRENGNAGFVALSEVGRSGRFATLEEWRNEASLDAHAAANKAAPDRLGPLLVAPPDRRPSVALDVAPSHGAAAGGVYVLTHVDVVPPKKDEAIALLKQLAPVSRQQRGAERFDVLQQISRPNHSFLVEIWRDSSAHDAHVTAAPTRNFRTRLLPLQGSLYDERVYRPIP